MLRQQAMNAACAPARWPRTRSWDSAWPASWPRRVVTPRASGSAALRERLWAGLADLPGCGAMAGPARRISSTSASRASKAKACSWACRSWRCPPARPATPAAPNPPSCCARWGATPRPRRARCASAWAPATTEAEIDAAIAAVRPRARRIVACLAGTARAVPERRANGGWVRPEPSAWAHGCGSGAARGRRHRAARPASRSTAARIPLPPAACCASAWLGRPHGAAGCRERLEQWRKAVDAPVEKTRAGCSLSKMRLPHFARGAFDPKEL